MALIKREIQRHRQTNNTRNLSKNLEEVSGHSPTLARASGAT
jgi:hypothetical protein